MRRQDLLNFYPQKYEEHLSPFGKQVLNVMIKQWRTDRERVKNISMEAHQHHCKTPKNKSRVLTFLDSNVKNTSTSTALDKTNAEEDPSNAHTPFDFRFDDTKSVAPVPLSAELVRTPRPIEVVGVNSYFGDDLINSVGVGNISRPRNILHDLYNNVSDGEVKECSIKNNGAGHGDNNRNVNWDNMIDDELLNDISPTNVSIQNEGIAVKSLKIPNDVKSKINSGKIYKNKTDKKTKCMDTNDSVLSKRKTQAKITDVLPKKIKKVETETSEAKTKNPFRKQKYTKTIKDWLNYVDPQNPVEEVATGPADAFDNEEELQMVTKTEIAIDNTSTVKSNKKVIQAQLANKGGVMKFGKPSARESSTTTGSEILVYGNGFNQLNSQPVEDPCLRAHLGE